MATWSQDKGCVLLLLLYSLYFVGSMADGDAAPPLEQPALVMVGNDPDPLQNFQDIQAAVNDMAAAAPNPVPMAEMLGHMARQLSSLTLQQKLTKKQNTVLLASARKARVDECVTKLSNPMSVRAVKLKFRVLHMLRTYWRCASQKGLSLCPPTWSPWGL